MEKAENLRPEHELPKEQAPTSHPPLRPNMLLLNSSATSSTFGKIHLDHCVFNGSMFFNTRFNRSNFESTSFDGSEFDGAVFENCSLRGVELRNCDVEGLVINGVRIGALLKLLHHD